MNKLNKLLDKYPVSTVVILTLLIGIIAIDSVSIPKDIESNQLPITNVKF